MVVAEVVVGPVARQAVESAGKSDGRNALRVTREDQGGLDVGGVGAVHQPDRMGEDAAVAPGPSGLVEPGRRERAGGAQDEAPSRRIGRSGRYVGGGQIGSISERLD